MLKQYNKANKMAIFALLLASSSDMNSNVQAVKLSDNIAPSECNGDCKTSPGG